MGGQVAIAPLDGEADGAEKVTELSGRVKADRHGPGFCCSRVEEGRDDPLGSGVPSRMEFDIAIATGFAVGAKQTSGADR